MCPTIPPWHWQRLEGEFIQIVDFWKHPWKEITNSCFPAKIKETAVCFGFSIDRGFKSKNELFNRN